MKIALALLLSMPAISLAQQIAVGEYAVDAAGNGFFPAIAVGPDGALWFTDYYNDKIGRITTAGAVTEYPIPSTPGFPWGIAAGPDGALWFTELYGDKIGRITTAGAITEYPTQGHVSEPMGIALGPDGALWFTEQESPHIGRITTAGAITQYPVPSGKSAFGITLGPDGALWFTEFAGSIGRITTAGSVTEYPVPGVTDFLSGITAGPDGALWFTETANNQIGRITTAGAITQFPLPTEQYGEPQGITTGPDGALWFTQLQWSNIGRITTAGVPSWYPLPINMGSSPYSITTGPDGELWMGANGGGKIGEAFFVTANLSVTPLSGDLGSNLTFSGSGFTPGEKVQIYISGVGSSVLASATADSTGAITTSARAPQSANGPRIFVGVGQSSGKLGAASFSMTARLIVNPPSGAPGSSAAVNGYGFGSLETVAVYWNSTNTSLGSATTDVHGTFNGSSAFSFTVPTDANPGVNTVVAIGSYTGVQVDGSFTVQ